MRLELAPRAVREAERCAAWWRENRPAARDLFEDELRAALERVRNTPLLGGIYEVVGGREYRRTLMAETRHHVYYRVVAPDVLRVVAIGTGAARRAQGARRPPPGPSMRHVVRTDVEQEEPRDEASGGAGNRTRVRKISSNWSYARVPE